MNNVASILDNLKALGYHGNQPRYFEVYELGEICQWLRTVKGVYVYPEYWQVEKVYVCNLVGVTKETIGIKCQVRDKSVLGEEFTITSTVKTFSTYEQALEAGIALALELVVRQEKMIPFVK